MENNDSFEYTYSAPEHEELRRIRDKYIPKQETKLERLRRLDASVARRGTVISLALGTISCLILGVGMCCCLVWEQYALGVPVGVLGMIGMALAYPVYGSVTRKERERIAPEILRLIDELEREK